MLSSVIFICYRRQLASFYIFKGFFVDNNSILHAARLFNFNALERRYRQKMRPRASIFKSCHSMARHPMRLRVSIFKFIYITRALIPWYLQEIQRIKNIL